MRGRLLLTDPRSGAWNMALDEALLLAAREDRLTLRLYSFRPATVTMGYFQRRSDVPPEIARRYPLTRRMTGGGAIIHEVEEITLSLSGLAARRPPRPEEALEWVLEGIGRALEPLGIRPRFAGSGGPASQASFFCGALRRAQDLVVDLSGGQVRKLMGTAQRRRGRAWLIHGSLTMARPPGERDLDGEALGVTVSEVLKAASDSISEPIPTPKERPPGLRDRLRDLLAEGFRHALKTELEPVALDPEENLLALRLLAERYSSPNWLARR